MTESPRAPALDASRLMRRLVDELVESQALKSPPWQGAFASVPRHVFLPRLFRPLPQAGSYLPVDGTRVDQQQEWLELIYSDQTWVTQLDGDEQVWNATSRTTVEGTPTSSSTMPSLMATMLDALDVADKHRVLEIGTGTGYNAALLCERLGSEHVTTIDVDPALTEQARERLSSLGYSPTVAATDAIHGYPPNAPYDRLIATCSVRAIPAAWLHQVAPGGMMLASLHRGLGGGPLARLTVTAGHAAQGHFLPHYASFMPARAQAAPEALQLLRRADRATGDARPTQLTGEALRDPDFAFLAAMLAPPDATEIEVESDEGNWEHWVLAGDGSWAYQTLTTRGEPITVQGGGSIHLWDRLEGIHRTWMHLGKPTRERFGLTVTSVTQNVWLDRPGNVVGQR